MNWWTSTLARLREWRCRQFGHEWSPWLYYSDFKYTPERIEGAIHTQDQIRESGRGRTCLRCGVSRYKDVAWDKFSTLSWTTIANDGEGWKK